MAISIPQNFYKEKVTLAVSAGATNIYVSNLPANSSGYLILSPSNASVREIIKFTASGTDGSGDFVTVTAPNRGLGGTTDQAHQVDEPVYMNVTAEHMQEIDDAIEAINTSGALNASTTTKGISKLSVAPVDPNEPKSVGDNDPRIPTPDQSNFLSGVTGMVVPFAGDTAPAGFLMCDGQLIDPATYKELFDVIGIKYGVDDGEVVTYENATDLITRVTHGYADDERLLFTSETALPTGISDDIAYFVINSTTNNFQISLTSGGTAIDFSDDGTGEQKSHQEIKVPDTRGSSIISSGQKETNLGSATLVFGQGGGYISGSQNTSDTVTIDQYSHGLKDGDQVMKIAGGSGGGTAQNTPYYISVVDDNRVYLYTSYADAIANTSRINITSNISSQTWVFGAYVTVDDPYLYRNGDKIVVSTDGVLPTGIIAGEYYVSFNNETSIKIHSTEAEALADQAFVSNGVGTGVHTGVFTRTSTTRSLGETGGTEKVRLSIAQMPAHKHDRVGTESPDINASYPSASINTNETFKETEPTFDQPWMSKTGGDEEQDNMSPFLVMNHIIKT